MNGKSMISRRESLLAFGVAFIAVLFFLITFSGFFESYDYLRLHTFHLEYLRNFLSDGKIPFWNPYVGLGIPLAANPEIAVFYPFTWLVLLLGANGYCAVSLAAHFALAAVSLLHFSRYLGATRSASWLAAFVFLASAQMFNRLSMGHLGLLNTACYLPLIFYLSARLQDEPGRKRCGQLALALGFQILAGHPQVVWITVIGAFLFLTGRRVERPLLSSLQAWVRDACLFGCGVALAAGIGAVIILPLQEYAGQSIRASAAPWYMTLLSMDRWNLAASFYEPWVFMGKMGEYAFYLGTLPLILGLLGLMRLHDRNLRGLWLVIAGALALGMTFRTPFFELLKAVVPGYSSFRGHVRFGLLLDFALAVAMGLGLSRRWSFTSLCGGMLVIFAGAAWLAQSSMAPMKSFGVNGPDWIRLVEFALLAGIWVMAWQKSNEIRPGRRRPLMLLLCASIGLDIALTYYWSKPEQPALTTQFPLEQQINSFVQQQRHTTPVPPRVLVSYLQARSDSALINGYSSPSFFVQLPLMRVWYYLHQYVNLPLSVELSAYPDRDIFQYGPFPYPTMNLWLGYDAAQHRLVENRAPDPRAYLVGTVIPLQDWKECIQFQQAHPGNHQVAFCETPSDGMYNETSPAASATITEFLPEKIKLRVQSPNESMLVLSESYYPGWKARIDQQVVDCIPLNIWMRGVRLPPGDREVEIFYDTGVFKLGAGLSLASLAVVLLLLGKPWWRPKLTTQK